MKRQPEELMISERVVDGLLGGSDDPTLRWNVSRLEILEALQTREGVARLAGVTRMTVFRQGIKPGTAKALEFARDKRRDSFQPLVDCPGALLDWRNVPGWYIHWWNTVLSIRNAKIAAGRRVVIDSTTPRDKRKRRDRIHHNPGATPITPAERELFRCYGYVYRKGSEVVTMKSLCGMLKITRQAIHKRLATLQTSSPVHWRLLDFWMRGELTVADVPALLGKKGKAETLPIADDFFADREPEVYLPDAV